MIASVKTNKQCEQEFVSSGSCLRKQHFFQEFFIMKMNSLMEKGVVTDSLLINQQMQSFYGKIVTVFVMCRSQYDI